MNNPNLWNDSQWNDYNAQKVETTKKIFNACEKHSRGKKIALQGRFVFTTEKMLQIAKEAKSINATKSVQKWPQKCPIQTILENNKDDMLNSESSSSDSDCIIVAARS